ncbi:M28 family peptidase [candidate division KSB1 bacterium]|nr:MAG: M28 family peptidase [candidate division KSB1 bacterium]MCE7941839.1 peptidase M28 [Chlorobi bacterium CHB1]
MNKLLSRFILVTSILLFASVKARQSAEDEAARLVSAMLGDTPIVADLRQLTDEIGGRATGSEANLKSVEWALAKFKEAGVEARKEGFMMPALWRERSVKIEITGAANFSPAAACMPFSSGTPATGLTAALIDGGFGADDDFKRLGAAAKGAFVLIETHELLDLEGLFKEYNEGARIEKRAFAAGVAGVVYTGSRPRNVLYRHNASLGYNNEHPLLVMERDAGLRCLRLLRAGKTLDMTATIDVVSGPAYESYNVVGEIKGTKKPEEFVVIGAHLDSWELGQGALDNGCNVALVIDLARQIKRLELKPLRTIRFALFNGEEQGLIGSWGYCKTHADELDRTVMASSYDIGTGRITGFFTGGRPELAAATTKALKSVEGLGPFMQIDVPIVGTDNFDFMMEGVGNLVANQESANYGPNYHAGSDTFDKVDLKQLRLNAAIAAAVTYGFATMEVNWKRQTRAEIEALMNATDLVAQMKSFNVWDDWANGKRGRQK